MNDNKLIMITTLLYLIVNLLIHIMFFLTTIYNNNNWQIFNISRHLFHRYFKQTDAKSVNSVNVQSFDTEQSCSNVLQIEQSESLVTNKIFSTSISSFSLSSYIILESETMLFRTIRSFGLFLCTCLLMVNWLRLGIYLFPIFYPNIIQYSTNLCYIQSFFLHVLTLFHFNLTISIRLFWHFCTVFSRYWQIITYRRLITIFICIFISLCILTWPSVSDEWASIIFDNLLNVCIVNYTFHLSYTFFILSFTCIIPFLLLILSHYRQMICIKRRILKYFTIFKIEQNKQNLIIYQQKQFQYASCIILIWSFINIILLICIHIPIEHERLIKSSIYFIQMFAFIFDPILYMFIFRSLAIITLLRPTNELYF
ncbi:unnamed protein product [Adineta steineri]|uniref:G-protein coupled receptors family 1 profile domain-containing protein n=2 Tax=Adineta steineri TaxID=433720 RepID=A0A814LPE8_9BILA|nr:unnamed protein product [Adineta steineri]CAF1449121.1 unnamed protein product [Adineta steineri]